LLEKYLFNWLSSYLHFIWIPDKAGLPKWEIEELHWVEARVFQFCPFSLIEHDFWTASSIHPHRKEQKLIRLKRSLG
jgi:hypothetical protein